MNNLEGLDNLFQLLSNELGVGIDVVKANVMEYILAYGRYSLIKDIPSFFMSWFFIGLITFFIYSLIVSQNKSFESQKDKLIKFGKRLAKIILLIAVVLYLYEVALYLIAPEIYSIERVYELIN